MLATLSFVYILDCMVAAEQVRYSVLPDTHGQYEKVARVVEVLEPETDVFVFLGDMLNGPDSAQLISLIRGLGSRGLAITGNHEWVCRNALNPEDELLEEGWGEQVWRYLEEWVVDSYGLKRSRSWKDNTLGLREAMNETGDLEWLNTLPPCIETDDFIAVHAGPELDIPWEQQATDLHAAALPEARLHEEPSQIFSHRLANAASVPRTVDERTFITGHSHLSLPPDDRIDQRRVRLASNLAACEPLFVWNSLHRAIEAY